MTVTEANHANMDGNRCFDEFFADRRRSMVNLATDMVDHRPIAEDIVQDAFHQVWKRWADLEQPAVYLRSTVVNRCHDELRRRRVQRAAARPLPEHPATEPPTYLGDLLADVTPRRRTALVLRYYGGHSVSEVAQAMDVPTGTAKSLIHRGLADLRLALN